jgi:hypothetical protein
MLSVTVDVIIKGVQIQTNPIKSTNIAWFALALVLTGSKVPILLTWFMLFSTMTCLVVCHALSRDWELK